MLPNVRGVCLLVCPFARLFVSHAAQLSFTVRGSFGAAFAKLRWPIVFILLIRSLYKFWLTFS